jgi:hypothetical protein
MREDAEEYYSKAPQVFTSGTYDGTKLSNGSKFAVADFDGRRALLCTPLKASLPVVSDAIIPDSTIAPVCHCSEYQ